MESNEELESGSREELSGFSEERFSEPLVDLSEGEFTRSIEQQTAKLQSINWLGLAVGSMVLSAGTTLMGRRDLGTFFGLWAPSLLLIGVYNKVVKLESKIDRSLMH